MYSDACLVEEESPLGLIAKTMWYGAWWIPVVAAMIAAAFDANWVLVYIITLIADLGLLTVLCVILAVVKTARENRKLTEVIENPGNDQAIRRPEIADAGIGLFFSAMGSILAVLPYALLLAHQPQGGGWIVFAVATFPMIGCFWVAYYHLNRYALTRTGWKLRCQSH